MEELNYLDILNRRTIFNNIKEILLSFEKNKTNLDFKRAIYIHGPPGCGKTYFVNYFLKELGFDIINYDAGDMRNKNSISILTKYNMSNKNVISLFNKKSKPIAIIMDEIDGMNNGDKGGINALIKLLRPKKTKRQKSEDFITSPVICIGNTVNDKKMKELIKVTHSFNLLQPTKEQIYSIMEMSMPDIFDHSDICNDIELYCQCDLRRLRFIQNLYRTNSVILKERRLLTLFSDKSINEDSKAITKRILNKKYCLSDYLTIMNETERTIVGLLFHENIIELIKKLDSFVALKIYLKILDNICYSDYIDRVTFQRQIWQFNEMSMLLKIGYSCFLFHNLKNKDLKFTLSEVRFTKVLTKYSTEFNNSNFINNMCQLLGLDKKDLMFFFLKLRKDYELNDIYTNLEPYEVTKLDVNRMYRYINLQTCLNTVDYSESITDNCFL